MQKAALLKIVNPAVGGVFLVQALSGILHSVIPWEVFHSTHGPLGYIMVALVLVHIYLNWSWIQTNYFKKKSKNVKNKTNSTTISITKEA